MGTLHHPLDHQDLLLARSRLVGSVRPWAGILTGLAQLFVSPIGGFITVVASVIGLLIGVILARIVAEYVLIMFRINEHLGAIRNRGQM